MNRSAQKKILVIAILLSLEALLVTEAGLRSFWYIYQASTKFGEPRTDVIGWIYPFIHIAGSWSIVALAWFIRGEVIKRTQ